MEQKFVQRCETKVDADACKASYIAFGGLWYAINRAGIFWQIWLLSLSVISGQVPSSTKSTPKSTKKNLRNNCHDTAPTNAK
jgi:hypothetical protein